MNSQPDEDPEWVYSSDEQRALTTNLFALSRRIHAGDFSEQVLAEGLLCELHRTLFAGVRDHAGRIRSKSFGSERLVFGPVRSEPREKVPALLKELMRECELRCEQLTREPTPERALAVIELAGEVHARFIRIHPFQDGNGRIGRCLMNIILVRLKLRPIPVEAAKQEYYAVLNAFHEHRDLRPLVDFLIRLASAE